MMKSVCVAALMVVGLSPLVLAEEPSTDVQGMQMTSIVTAKVKGMVCDFCAQSVVKVFGEEPGVVSVDVDLNTQEILVTLATDATLTDEKVKELIHWAGYDFVSIERSNS